MIRVLIAGDVRLYREGLSLHLAQQEDIQVVGSSAHASETCQLASELRPDVVLLDMATRSSLRIARELRAIAPETRVLALTVPELEDAMLACAEAGVAGFVVRDASLADLVDALHAAARGEVLLTPRVAASLLRRVGALAADRDAAPMSIALTAREQTIAALLGDGLSNKEIAARLHVELATVKNHVHNILEKLQVRRRGEIVARLRSPIHAPSRLEVDYARLDTLR